MTVAPFSPTARSRELLETRSNALAESIHEWENKRRDLLEMLKGADQRLISMRNEQSDYLSAISRLDGNNQKFMPSDLPAVESSDTYIPNPFAGLDHLARDKIPFSNDEGLDLEAADQIGGMVYLDADITLCGFTREGLIKFIHWCKGDAQ